MKIQGNHPKLTGQEKAGQTDRTKDESSVKAQQAQSKAKGLSDSSTLTVSRMRDRINAEPDVNLDRVKALKAKIKEGSYKVDTAKLAGNILKDSAIEDV